MMFNNFDYSAGPALFALPVLVVALMAPFAPGGTLSVRAPSAALIAGGAFVIYGFGVLYVVFLPLPADPAAFCAAAGGNGGFSLEPFRWVRGIFHFMDDQGQRLTLQGFLHNETIGQALNNLGLFIPFGVGLRLLFGLRFAPALAIVFGASLAIEVIQGSGMLGLLPCPHRLGDVDDLVLNVAGAVTGWLAAGFLGRTRSVRVGHRFVAFAIDLALVEAALIVVNAAAGAFRPGPYAIAAAVVAVVLVVVPVAINRGVTVGKALVGIRLVARGGGALPLWRIVIRYSVLFGVPIGLVLWPQIALSPETNDVTAQKALIFGAEALAMAILGPVMMLLRRDGRGLHDLVSGSDHRPIGAPEAPGAS